MYCCGWSIRIILLVPFVFYPSVGILIFIEVKSYYRLLVYQKSPSAINQHFIFSKTILCINFLLNQRNLLKRSFVKKLQNKLEVVEAFLRYSTIGKIEGHLHEEMVFVMKIIEYFKLCSRKKSGVEIQFLWRVVDFESFRFVKFIKVII